MPQQTYRVTDPTSGRTVRLTGDSPPTEAELEEVFKSVNAKPDTAAKAEPAPSGSWLGDALDFGIGVLKSPAAIVEAGGNAIRNYVPGVKQFENATGAVIDTGINAEPTNGWQTAGRITGDIGTAFVPGGGVTRLAKGAAELVPAG